jgi:hypothetical protein
MENARMSEDTNKKLEEVLRDLTQDSKSMRMVKFLLFSEDYPVHKVKYDITVLDCIVVCFLPAIFGTLGFLVWGSFTFLGFLLYLVAVYVLLLEVLHIIYDRQSES